MRTSTTQPPLGTPLLRSHPLSKGLRGNWLLNEGGGTKAFDSVLNNHGTLANGAVYTKHVRGSCVSFDGTDDIVSTIGLVSSYSFIQNTQVFSISAWVQLNNNTARQGLVANINSALSKGFYLIFENGAGVGNKALRLTMGNGGGSAQGTAITGDNVITDLNWHHVVVTGGGSGNTITFYVDSVLKPTTYITSFGSLSTGDSAFLLQFGATVGPGFALLNGRENDVKIYDRTLSATEVRQLYTNPYQMYIGKK